MRKFLLFRIQQQQFAMDLLQVIDVRKLNMVTTESSDRFTQGIRTPEGTNLTMFDLPLLINHQHRPTPNNDAQLMLVNAEGTIIGLKVDHVSRVISLDHDWLEPLPPVFGNSSLNCFPMILKLNELLIPLLNPAGIKKYEQFIGEIREDVNAPPTPAEAIDDFDVIELTEVVGLPPATAQAGMQDDQEDQFLQTLDLAPQPEAALIPLLEDPSGLPPAEIISENKVTQKQPSGSFENWSFLPKKEAELEQFFINMITDPRIASMISNTIQRLAKAAVYREIARLKAQKVFFPNVARNAANE